MEVAASPAERRVALEQLSIPALIALHLIPGALVTIAFVVLAPVAEAAGFPPIAGLLAAIALVMVPVELGIIAWAGRSAGGSAWSAISYREPMALRQWAWLVPVLIVAAFLGFGLHMVIEPQLISSLFGWLPEWFVSPVSLDSVETYSPTVWLITLGAYFALNGFAGPIVEELYFRGYLLPRMERFGRAAPLLNVVLFSLYHFWSPWQFLARVLGIGPTVYAVRWKRNIYLGMVVHCTLNVLGITTVALLISGRM
ncbi:CPBP family intramembrane glutamic endopeptidase [Aeromicrobium sp.]